MKRIHDVRIAFTDSIRCGYLLLTYRVASWLRWQQRNGKMVLLKMAWC